MASHRRTRKTKYAIFSGYDMSRQVFIDMVAQMPSSRLDVASKDLDLEDCVATYDAWSREHGAPTIMPLYESDIFENDDTFGAVSSFFLPIRFIDYTGKSQLRDADNAPFAQETDKDKALLAKFARHLGDAPPLDTTKFTFGWVKDYHPEYDYLNGTWIR